MIRISRSESRSITFLSGIKRFSADLSFAAVKEASKKESIIRDFQDPYLELIRLIREAAEIEHSLMLQYLYAAFSVKPEYNLLVGWGNPNAEDLLGVAVQEMQHLSMVNYLLLDLGAAPVLDRQDFPYEPDIYPFELNLEPLSLATLAKYIYTEAAANRIDPADPANAPEHEFLNKLYEQLGSGVRPNHLGSLYATLIEVLSELITNPVAGLPNLQPWISRLERIKGQGEDDHFLFFKSVFQGAHFAFDGIPDVWSDPKSEAYPVIPLPTNPSAYVGSDNEIKDVMARELAWLGNLQYWITLILLMMGYSGNSPLFIARAKEHMTGPLLRLGQHLAILGFGMPFDRLSMGYSPGKDSVYNRRILSSLLSEAEQLTAKHKPHLPSDFPFATNEITISSLNN